MVNLMVCIATTYTLVLSPSLPGKRLTCVNVSVAQLDQRLFVLQVTHDEAIQSRVHLKLMSESEGQSQALEEFKLRREKERTKLSELNPMPTGPVLWPFNWQFILCSPNSIT